MNGTEYQRLFVYDTPVEVGVPSFGYAHIDGAGSLFSMNTRLAHDFAGAGTRSGNLLNHSVLTDGLVDFYPAELFGSPILRTEMDEAEVNSEDAPDYLPSLTVEPAGAINIEEIGDWLDGRGGAEPLERLLGAYLAAMNEGKALIILDTPANVTRWVAALEYCLPLKLARTISFVNFSENAASVKASIAGTSRELFEANTPSYMLASISVFDPGKAEEHALPDGPFIDFVDISYSLNPSALSQFASFVDAGIDTESGLSLEGLNNAYAVYSLTKDDASDWTPSVIHDGLNYAIANGTDELNAQIERIIESNHDALAALESDSYLEILEYLIRRWPMLDEEGKRFVEGVATGNVMGLLQQENVDESIYQDYFDAITRACASAGLNIFEILMEEESRTRLFATAQKLSLPKLKLLANSLTQFVLASKQPLDKLTTDAPLGALYACLLECAFAQGGVAGTGLAQCIISAASAKLPYLENLMMTIDWAARKSFHRVGATGSAEEQAAIDAIWDSCIALITAQHGNEIAAAAKWLIWAAGYDHARFRYLVDLHERLSANCRSTDEALGLFSAICPESAFADDAFMANAYPQIASRFALALRQFNDENTAETARGLLEASLNSRYRLDFIPSLMEMVSEDFGIKKTAPADLRLIDKAADYEYWTGGLALSGKAALIDAANLLEEAPRTNNPIQALEQLEGLSTSFNLNSLDERAFKEYVKRIAPAAAKIARNGDDFARVVSAYGLLGDRLTLLLSEAFDYAMKELNKRDNPGSLIALTSYTAMAADRNADATCIRAIASAKTEDDLFYIDDLTRRALRTAGASAVKRWSRIFDQAYDRHGRGLLGRFRR
ncbi:MAG: hypothetical protein J6D25_00265 [Eggerthellaceae bacterium]|nr:hypothetical protein [Eggerthellaceae bacterium]